MKIVPALALAQRIIPRSRMRGHWDQGLYILYYRDARVGRASLSLCSPDAMPVSSCTNWLALAGAACNSEKRGGKTRRIGIY